MASTTIPQFLLPRGISQRTLRYLSRHQHKNLVANRQQQRRSASTSSSNDDGKQRVLAQPDKFRPPSHPARRVLQTRNGKVYAPPYNYPGPPLSAKEKEEMRTKRYPHMFPPEGTVMYKFLTSRWIHIWIAMGVLTSLATFTFTTNFKRTSPFAHLLPPWSGLLSHPIDTISQAISVYKMHVAHESEVAREKRHRRIEDAEKRRQYRIAHGLEEPGEGDAGAKGDGAAAAEAEKAAPGKDEYVDWEGRRRPVKKWLGIW
ncbi:hypothetical protein VTN00DRAFT_6843 [Thermoascus crustaceus]|uniref:uncharacterized protein n=1 Tax=Thermoascus crustaceus TaxID=5088 RepID=UPI00374211BC